MPKIYGVSKSGRIHREEQTPHDPDNPKPSRYAPPVKKRVERSAESKKVMVVDTHTGTSRTYASTREAANAIGCSQSRVGDRTRGAVHSLIYDRYYIAVPEED